MPYRDEIQQTRAELRVLNKAIPEATRGFAQLSLAVKDNGVLEVKYKECVALGIAVATHCTPCIDYHVEALMKTGASRGELADVLAMAIQMGGGPALMMAGRALAVWDELEAE